LGPKGNLIYKLVSTTDHKLIGMMSIVPMGQVAEPQDELALPYVIRLRFREGAVSDGGGGVGDGSHSSEYMSRLRQRSGMLTAPD
jgi:hypothetical protein